LSSSLLIRGSFAAVRQEIHSSACPNFPGHLSHHGLNQAPWANCMKLILL
jgi:hypothetical protein